MNDRLLSSSLLIRCLAQRYAVLHPLAVRVIPDCSTYIHIEISTVSANFINPFSADFQLIDDESDKLTLSDPHPP
jgi:hypothetical protein